MGESFEPVAPGHIICQNDGERVKVKCNVFRVNFCIHINHLESFQNRINATVLSVVYKHHNNTIRITIQHKVVCKMPRPKG